MTRGQGTLEFTLITIAMLIVFATAIIAIEQRYLDIQEDRVDQQAQQALERVLTEVELAHRAGAGYTRTFYLPITLSGIPYTITLNENTTAAGFDELVVTTQGREHLRFIDHDVNGTLGKGKHNITGGTPIEITTLE